MNHHTAEEQLLAERYLKGALSPEDEARFEEHYLSCQECLDQLALGESLQRGFRRVAGQEVARQAAARQLAVVTWLNRLSRSQQIAALAMTLLAVVLLPTGFALNERSKLEREREQRAASEHEHANAAEELRAELEASQREMNEERAARARVQAELASAQAPQGNVPILFLDAMRGEGEPTHRVRLPATPGWIVLAPQLEPPFRDEYRAALRAADGRQVWQGSGLRRNAMETVSLSLPSTLLSPGDYQLVVEGRRFPFRVLPAD